MSQDLKKLAEELDNKITEDLIPCGTPVYDLKAEILKVLQKVRNDTSKQAYLGNATTQELFNEIMARIGTADLKYKPTETDQERFERRALHIQETLKTKPSEGK